MPSPSTGDSPMFELDSPRGLFRALAFIAWSDDRIAPEERQAMMSLCDALDLPGPEREVCLSYLEERPTLEGLGRELTDPVEARFVVTQALVMAWADGEFSSIEQDDVARLAAELGIPEDELHDIQADVEEVYLPTMPGRSTG